MKKIFYILAIFTIISANADTRMYNNHYYNPQHQAQIDNMLNRRLNLTQEQQMYIMQRRPQRIEQMQDTVGKMQNVHDRIKDVYTNQNLPRYQADIKTAPMKAELAILKQNAQKQKEQNRKDFESILTKQQRAEFEKMRHEHYQKNYRRY